MTGFCFCWALLLLQGPTLLSALRVTGKDCVHPLVFRAAHTQSKPQLSLNLVLLSPQPVVFLENTPLGVPELTGTSPGQEVKEYPGPPNLAPAMSQTVLWPSLLIMFYLSLPFRFTGLLALVSPTSALLSSRAYARAVQTAGRSHILGQPRTLVESGSFLVPRSALE